MKPTLTRIDKLSIVSIIVLVIGILGSFFDFGIFSVLFSVILPLLFILNCAFAIYGLFKKKYFHLIGVVLFLIFCNSFIQFSRVSDDEKDDVVSVLVYNTREFQQYLPDETKQNESNGIIKFVDSLNADILVFQEYSYLKGKDIKGYPYYFLGYRENIAKSLLMIYSKYPIVNEGYIDFRNTMNNAIYANIKINQDTIRIYNSHLQSFVVNKYILAHTYDKGSFWKNINSTITKQIEQAKQIKNHANQSNKKVIICGDFNATPYSPTYRTMTSEMKDSYINNGNGLGKTYDIYNYPLRLDYFLYDKNIEVISHNNFNINLSDHEPIHVRFKIK